VEDLPSDPGMSGPDKPSVLAIGAKAPSDPAGMPFGNTVRLDYYCRVCSSLPGLKRTAFPGGMATSAPVRGLRPIPVLRGRTLKIPKPRSSMRSPLPRARFILSNTVSTAISAFVLVMPVRLTTSLMMSSLIKIASLANASKPHDRIRFNPLSSGGSEQAGNAWLSIICLYASRRARRKLNI